MTDPANPSASPSAQTPAPVRHGRLSEGGRSTFIELGNLAHAPPTIRARYEAMRDFILDIGVHPERLELEIIRRCGVSFAFSQAEDVARIAAVPPPPEITVIDMSMLTSMLEKMATTVTLAEMLAAQNDRLALLAETNVKHVKKPRRGTKDRPATRSPCTQHNATDSVS